MEISEISANIIAHETRMEGKITFENYTRVYGELVGDVVCKKDCTLVVGETGVIEGKLQAQILIVEGFVRGDIQADEKVVITRTGRVVGSIDCPNLQIEFGAYFDGECFMDDQPSHHKITADLQPSVS